MSQRHQRQGRLGAVMDLRRAEGWSGGIDLKASPGQLEQLLTQMPRGHAEKEKEKVASFLGWLNFGDTLLQKIKDKRGTTGQLG